jgi:hypothetical protein
MNPWSHLYACSSEFKISEAEKWRRIYLFNIVQRLQKEGSREGIAKLHSGSHST